MIFLYLTALCEIFIVLLHPIIRYYFFKDKNIIRKRAVDETAR